MKEALAQFAPVLATLLFTLLTGVLSLAANQLRLKLKSQRATEILDRVEHLANDVVLEGEQTVVSGLKKRSQDGTLSQQDADDIRADAIAKLKLHLGPKGVTELLHAFGFKTEADMDALLKTKVEAQVSALRGPG